MASYPVLLSVLSLLVAVGWAAPVPALAQTEVRTQLGWLRNGEFAPVMVAEAYYLAEALGSDLVEIWAEAERRVTAGA